MADKAQHGENTEQAKRRRKEMLGVEILAYENLLKMHPPHEAGSWQLLPKPLW
ncbi:hypothetical protein [Enterobacter hormaechei]|uniref:hypothetical protein n=1 Tax=Enterobacter hormaechei TaxID=158836 RepID=UPI002A75F58A|nr:hypothetical protein [Enterobacter hormaechei]MDY3572429.1 hypothetical protein [Enterobacter hormaechei]